MKWPFSKSKPLPQQPKGMFDESKAVKAKTKVKTEYEQDMDKILASVRERILPKRVKAETLMHKESKMGETLVRIVNRILGKKDYKKDYEHSEAHLLKAIDVCKERKAFTREQWEENRVEIDKVLKKYMEASVRYAEWLYDQQTAKPLDRASNKFVKE